jgi:hypothetical protein
MLINNHLNNNSPNGRNTNLLELVLSSAAASYAFYALYYFFAPTIWAQNPIRPLYEYTPWMRYYATEHDGVEVYALYSLLFANILLSASLAWLCRKINGNIKRYSVLTCLFASACYYFYHLGFFPPMSPHSTNSLPSLSNQNIYPLAGGLLVLATLCYTQKYADKWLPWLAALLLLPVCFIATAPTSWVDNGYIFSPALRVLHGIQLSRIYFQYDLFISLLAVLWIKMRLDLNYFQVLGQSSFYVLILGIFLFSRKLFIDRYLPIFLFLSLALIKIYALLGDPVTCFQVTPLRLDLWFPLLVIAYAKGHRHWSTAVYLGLLIIFHRNFGIIYTAAFFQLQLTMFFIDLLPLPQANKITITTISTLFVEYIRKLKYHLLTTMSAFLIGTLWLKGQNQGTADLYLKTGFGFIQIDKHSFYWQAIILICFTWLLLFRLRESIPERYLYSGFLIIYLGIGNSIYFFGRSHENNIINISACLIFVFFMMLDLVKCHINLFNKNSNHITNNIQIVVATLFIVSILIFYNEIITSKSMTQFANAKVSRTIYPPDDSLQMIRNSVSTIRAVTHDSPKVYFISFIDFLYYYSGGYTPEGYFSPFQTWISVNEQARFLQNLVNDGYYLVIDDVSLINDLLPLIPYNKSIVRDGLLFIWQEKLFRLGN